MLVTSIFSLSHNVFYPSKSPFSRPPRLVIWASCNSFLTDDDTQSFCWHCRSRSDCTECAIWSVINTVHIFRFRLWINCFFILKLKCILSQWKSMIYLYLVVKAWTLWQTNLCFNPFQIDKFQTLPNWKSLQTTILNLMKMAESSANG